MKKLGNVSRTEAIAKEIREAPKHSVILVKYGGNCTDAAIKDSNGVLIVARGSEYTSIFEDDANNVILTKDIVFWVEEFGNNAEFFLLERDEIGS